MTQINECQLKFKQSAEQLGDVVNVNVNVRVVNFFSAVQDVFRLPSIRLFV